MLSSILYFTFAMLFIALVVFYLWKYDSVAAKIRLSGKSDENIKTPSSLRPVINSERCIGCGFCTEACPESVIELKNNKAVVRSANNCIGHGACFSACPFQAITLVSGVESRGEQLPHLHANFETESPGIFIAGELGGMGHIRNASIQAVMAVKNIVSSMGMSSKADFDLIIVGAGVAGLSAALAASENNIRYLVLEQDTVELSLRNHPSRIVTGQVALDLPLAGRIVLKNSTVKQLIDLWNGIIIKYRLPLQEYCRVKSVIKLNGYYNVITSEHHNFTSSYVLLAIGIKGSTEKLNIPGENLNKVAYRIDNPGRITGKRIVISGNNSIAVETALSLSEKNDICLVCNGESFAPLDVPVRKSVENVLKSGKITIFYNTELISIDEKYVYLSGEEGFIKLGNDLVFILNGGEQTSEFLEKAGIGTSLVESYLHQH